MSQDATPTRENLLIQLRDPDPMTRIDAAFALARQGSFAGRDVLLDALKDQDAEVRARAANRLGRIGPAWVVDPLGSLVADPDSAVRNDAIFGLLGTGRPAAVRWLLQALGDEDPARREDARVALVELLGDGAAAQLGDLVEEPGEASRFAAWWKAHQARFDPRIVHAAGRPASVGDWVDRLRSAPPEEIEAITDRLHDWTGQRFSGSVPERVAAWQSWWKQNARSFPPGRRYFNGRPVDELNP